MEALLEVVILLENICIPIEGNKNDIIYHFCGMMIKSGRITQFKFHLLLAIMCSWVPLSILNYMNGYL